MIYIKTNMSEMPKNCSDCRLIRDGYILRCHATGNSIDDVCQINNDCPLISEAEIIQLIVEEITKLINVPLNSVQDALDIIKEHLEGKNEG